jgi:hypothetical protein
VCVFPRKVTEGGGWEERGQFEKGGGGKSPHTDTPGFDALEMFVWVDVAGGEDEEEAEEEEEEV